ncbi:hydrogenase 4 subunit B [Azospirillum sp. HJ39]|uniref:hydrogenase 4 subunit B n=1 Tax=Azospirillum sp. HJ39 TaxID=3159496 RepID=UPI00355613F2
MAIPLSSILLLFSAALLAVAARNRHWTANAVYGATAAACGLTVLWAVTTLATGAVVPAALTLPIGLPWSGSHLRADALSVFFLLVVNGGGLTASLFGWGYERAHHDSSQQGDSHPRGGPVLPFFPLFLAGMSLVLLADDAFTFLVSWEFMSLASWLLVLSTHREVATPPAARLYLIMAGVGTLCLMLAFGLMAGGPGDMSFAAIRAHAPGSGTAVAALLLVLLGAGSKAGLFPLHVWLPLAHPAAPSHVSALMSGVMTKVAVYAIVRVAFDLLGPPSWWWGGVLMAAGTVTAVMGVMIALMQDDLKRLLACSTIENIGVIVIALGLALVFKASSTPVIAALAMSAALLHVVNHSLFKSLLFFVAGSVLTATGTRDLNRLGGLIHRMPATAVLALVGAAAISALPPLNGFVGEWMLFQAILNAPALPEWSLKIGIAVVGAAVALAAALAAACFVRFYGIAFLGRPRSVEAAGAREVGMAMRLAMLVPAMLCIAIGVLPTPLIRLFGPAVRAMVEAGPFDDRAYQPWFWLAPTSAVGNSYNGMVLLVAIAALSALLVLVIHRRASDRVRWSDAWGCGHEEPDPAALSQYSAGSFGQPIRRAFGTTLLAAQDSVSMPEPGDTRPARLSVSWRDPAWPLLFTPVGRAVDWLADRSNHLQFLTIRRYLTLMFAALVVVLVLVAVVRS